MCDDVIPHGRHTCTRPPGLSWFTGFVIGLCLIGWADLTPSIACLCGSPAGCKFKHAGREVEHQRATASCADTNFLPGPNHVFVCMCASVCPHCELECVSVSVGVPVWDENVKLFFLPLPSPAWLPQIVWLAHTYTNFREVNPSSKTTPLSIHYPFRLGIKLFLYILSVIACSLSSS